MDDRPFKILQHLYRGTKDLARHHHDSYDRLLRSQIPSLIQEINPIKIPLVQKERVAILEQGREGESAMNVAAPLERFTDEDDRMDAMVYAEHDAVISIFIGGRDGTSIQIRKPVIVEQNQDGERVSFPMYPNEARLRKLNYVAPISVDVYIRILNIRTGEAKDITIPDIPFFSLPILVKSAACWLHGMTEDALREVGEDTDDPGGYFIVGGAERVLVTQERVIPNLPYVNSTPEVMIACSNPDSSRVKVFRVHFNKAGAIEASVPGVKGIVPVGVLFRALGVVSDLDIVRTIFNTSTPDPEEADVIRTTLASSHGIYDQLSAMRLLTHSSRGLTLASARNIIYEQLFSQQSGGLPEKAAVLGNLVKMLIHRKLGRITDTDRDSLSNKKVGITGSLLAELLDEVIQTREEDIRRRISSEYNYNNSTYKGDLVFQLLDVIMSQREQIFNSTANTSLILRSVRGQWGADPEKGQGAEIEGVSQALDRLTNIATLSHLRRVALERVPEGKALMARRQHMSSFGYICPSETPSGGPKIGVVKNLASLTQVSSGVRQRELLELLPKLRVKQVHDVPATNRSGLYTVYVNGVLVGYVENGATLQQELLGRRRRGLIHPTVSIAFHRLKRYVWISTDSGRMMRPLIRVKDGRPMIDEAVRQIADAAKDGGNPMNAFSVSAFEDPDASVRGSTGGASVDGGEVALEMIDPLEMETLYVAMTPEEVTGEHTHVEVHASSILGVVASLIPYSPHNAAVRNLYSCAQTKQALAVYSKAYRSRFDHSSIILTSTQRPIVNTWWGRRLGDNGLAYGMNLIVAIMCFTGYNQEDSLLINRSSVERGLYRIVKMEETSAEEEKDEKTRTTVRIVDPRTIPGIRTNPDADYGYLSPDGTLMEGTKLKPGMVLFGKVSETEGELPRDVSVVAGRFAKGIVESKVVLRLAGGHRLVRYKIATFRGPEFGDKFSARAGQKGTCGMLISQADMPRNADGICPDLILNPHAIPSRMTIGQFQETAISKLAALVGADVDATAFTQAGGVFGDKLGDMLISHGFDPFGDEILYSGITGEIMHTKIFIGPTYYMRLKHMVADKINYRSGGVDRGPIDAKIRQPIGGRAREGGLRVGEMERDAIISHGASRFLQESHTTRSDGEYAIMCADTGKRGFLGDGKNVYPGLRSIDADGPFRFRGTRADTLENTANTTKSNRFSEVSFPRALGVMFHETETMGIESRILTEGGSLRLRPDSMGGAPEEDEIARILERVFQEDPALPEPSGTRSPIILRSGAEEEEAEEEEETKAPEEAPGVGAVIGGAIAGALSTLGFGGGEEESKEELPPTPTPPEGGQVGMGRTHSSGSGASVLREVLSEKINERHQSRMALQRLQEGFGRQAESGAFGENIQHSAIERRGEQEGIGLLNRLRGSILESASSNENMISMEQQPLSAPQNGGRRRANRGNGGGGSVKGGIESQGGPGGEDTPAQVVTVVKEG
jgi:DNA-directed RNA polymerase beta subunit